MATTKRVRFVCDGAAVPSRLAAPGWQEREIRSRGPGADLDLHLQALGSVLRQAVSPRASDLVRIAAYAHRADTMVSRGGERDSHGTGWKRRLPLCIPVADPDHWEQGPVRKRLAAALGFATGDAWEFAFDQADPELVQVPLAVQEREVLGEPKAVVLVSGGADSLCAVLEAAANGERPLAVGHWSTATHRARQEDLLGAAARALKTWSFPHVGFRIHRGGAAWADNSQRSRAFLFASLGAAVAAELGIGRVYLPDNGPVSLNLPINDQVVGAQASRSTHPKFLYLFNELVADLFPTLVQVSNPLAGRTRAEVLRALTATGCEHLLPRTLSCSNWRRLPQQTPHCGVCSQCVDRRFATVAAGLAAFDPADRYQRDVFLDDLERWQARMTAESYVRFAQRVLPMGTDELFRAYPQLRDAAVPGMPDPDGAILGAIDVVKRHVGTVLGVLKAMLVEHADACVAGTLPAGCLLRLAQAGTHEGECGGPAARAEPAAPAVAARAQGPGPANVFALEGERWVVSFAGTTTYLHPAKGLAVVAMLLGHPGRCFTAAEIEARLGPLGEPGDGAGADEEGLRPEAYAGGGTVLEAEDVALYRQTIADLEQDLDAARADNDLARLAMLEEQIAVVKREVNAAVGLGGRLRPFADNLTRQTGRVSRCVRRALERIKRAHPELDAHLRRSLDRRGAYCYRPETESTWRVTPPTS